MSKHPTERVRTVQELQATSMQQSDKALRRIALIEERLARSEGRLAEKDQMLADFQEAYARQADTITALTAVVRELEAKVGRGVDQVITGLEGRIAELERENANGYNELRGLIQSRGGLMESDKQILRLADAFFDTPAGELVPTLSQLQRKRGRLKGSKNKPKSTPAQAFVEELEAEFSENTLQDGDSSNHEASEGQ